MNDPRANPPRCLVDAIEHYGRRSEPGGDLTRTDAIHLLQQFSDGGLTRLGAERSILNWRTSRAAYEREFRRALDSLDRILREAE